MAAPNLARCAGCGATPPAGELFGPRTAGGDSSICAACLAQCSRTLADSPTRIPGGSLACAFCGKPEDRAVAIVTVGAKVICDECVDTFRSR